MNDIKEAERQWLEELLLPLFFPENVFSPQPNENTKRRIEEAAQAILSHFKAEREKAYRQGRIDEAKVCEKTQRHDTKKIVEKAVREARIEEMERLAKRYETVIDTSEKRFLANVYAENRLKQLQSAPESGRKEEEE